MEIKELKMGDLFSIIKYKRCPQNRYYAEFIDFNNKNKIGMSCMPTEGSILLYLGRNMSFTGPGAGFQKYLRGDKIIYRDDSELGAAIIIKLVNSTDLGAI